MERGFKMNLLTLKDKGPTQKLVFAAIMACIAFLLNFIEIPFIVPYLRFDFSETIVIITVMICGLRFGLMVSIIKALLFYLFGANGSEIVGVSILLFSSCFLAIIYYLFYNLLSKLMKMNTAIVLTFIICAFIYAIALTLLNYRITVPLYSGVSFDVINQPGYLWSIVSLYFPFNIIKIAIIGVIVSIFSRIFFKDSQKQ
jgi:riboflavin transporter FmnP